MLGSDSLFSPVQPPSRSVRKRVPWGRETQQNPIYEESPPPCVNTPDCYVESEPSPRRRAVRPVLPPASASSFESFRQRTNGDAMLRTARIGLAVRSNRERRTGTCAAARICRCCVGLALLAVLGIIAVAASMRHRTGTALGEDERSTPRSGHITGRDLRSEKWPISRAAPVMQEVEHAATNVVRSGPPQAQTRQGAKDSDIRDSEKRPTSRRAPVMQEVELPPRNVARHETPKAQKRQDAEDSDKGETIADFGDARAAGLSFIAGDSTSTVLHSKQTESDPGREEHEPCWVYMHMEKSGARFIRSVAADRWRNGERIVDSVQWRRGDEHIADVMSHMHWQLVHGGCVEALRIHEDTGARKCRWFTVFRHPVARLVAAYDHCRKAAQDPLCGAGNTADLESFARHWGNFGLRQFALATTSSNEVKEWGAKPRAPFARSVWYMLKGYLSQGSDTDDARLEGVLPMAKVLLSTRYAAVGIAEDMDKTLALFNRALFMTDLDWSRSVQERSARSTDEEFRDTVAEDRIRDAMDSPTIMRTLRLDILLYQHAQDVFREQLESYGL